MVKLTTKIASLKLFASYAIATYILVILTSALNLFKGYVADTFYIAETLLIVLTHHFNYHFNNGTNMEAS
ncbi:Oligopeptide transport system permease protein [Staphylococcus aureus]|nr:conserved domain protein [Staphylococcus aureus subsp. aureus 21305]CAC6912821.1 Oligopeptide transport system permease protein [Staphylococcus aureus]CAC6961225.1 Oligopeptide transport system permease protein [Staphylococcus aureus]